MVGIIYILICRILLICYKTKIFTFILASWTNRQLTKLLFILYIIGIGRLCQIKGNRKTDRYMCLDKVSVISMKLWQNTIYNFHWQLSKQLWRNTTDVKHVFRQCGYSSEITATVQSNYCNFLFIMPSHKIEYFNLYIKNLHRLNCFICYASFLTVVYRVTRTIERLSFLEKFILVLNLNENFTQGVMKIENELRSEWSGKAILKSSHACVFFGNSGRSGVFRDSISWFCRGNAVRTSSWLTKLNSLLISFGSSKPCIYLKSSYTSLKFGVLKKTISNV